LGRPASPRWEWWEAGGEVEATGSAGLLLLTKFPNEHQIRLGIWAGLTQHQKNVFYADAERLKRLSDAVGSNPRGHWTLHLQWMLELKPPRFDHGTQRLVDKEDDIAGRLLATQALVHKLNTTVPKSQLKSFVVDFIDAGLTTREAFEGALDKSNSYGYAHWKLIAPVYAYCTWELDDAIRLDDPNRSGQNPLEAEIADAAGWLTQLVGAEIAPIDGSS
jgi:hypothetical protein